MKEFSANSYIKLTITAFGLVLLFIVPSLAQNNGVLIDPSETLTRHQSATLEVGSLQSTTANDYGGFLAPRMTLTNRGNIASPAAGLLVYQTDNTPGYYYFDGSTWTRLFEGTGNNNVIGSGTTNYLARWTSATALGTGVTYDNGTNVGIGNTSPGFKLHVAGDFHAEGKIVVQNSVDGGSSRGIWMWNAGDSNWGIYMGQSGAGRSLSGGTAVGGGGFTSHAIRTRVNNASTQGIIFENSAESLLFSVRGSDGQAYHKGNVGINTDPSARLHILVADDQNDNPATNGIYVQNNDVSGDNGDAIITARVGGPSGGDPFFSMDVNGVTGWSVGLDNSDEDKLKFANSWSNPGTNTRMTIQTDGNVGIGDASPSYTLEVLGTTNLSRDNTGVCCPDANGYTLSIAENTAGTGRHPSIQFHSSGVAEGQIRLAQYNMAGLPYSNRRMHFFDNQNIGLGLELSGNLFYGNNSSRTQTRDNNTLRGNSNGILSGFYETSSATTGEGYPENSNSWVHLLDVRHSNPDNNYAMQMAGSFFDQDFFVRKTNNNGSQGWGRVVTDRDMVYSQSRGTYSLNNANSGYRTVGVATGAMAVKSGDVIAISHTSKFRWTGGSGGDHPFYGIYISGCATTSVTDVERIGTADDLPRGQWQSISGNYVWVATCDGTVQFTLYVDNNSDADDNSEFRDIVIIANRY
jgi:hypothetical protein